jgi:hypothetical protein
MQQRLTCANKNARLLPDGCCCLNDKGNEILFRINISPPWTGRGGPMSFSPRSLDFTLNDFFLWGHIKALIYTTPIDSEEGVTARIVVAAATIRQQTGIFERKLQSLLRCSRLCIEVGCHTFEHLLYIGTKCIFFQNTLVVLLDFKP